VKNKKIVFLAFFTVLAVYIDHPIVARNKKSHSSVKKEHGSYILEQLRKEGLSVLADAVSNSEELVGIEPETAKKYFAAIQSKAHKKYNDRTYA